MFLESRLNVTEVNHLGNKCSSPQFPFERPSMQVTRRRATIDDADVLLDLINTAYKHEGKWKVDDKRTSAKELARLLPDQDLHPDSGDYQVLMVLVADDGEDISILPEIASKSRIVGHIRYVASFRALPRFFAVSDPVCCLSDP